MTKIFILSASTGCSCCSYENFERGPYTEETKYIAEADIAEWRKGNGNPLASQYARYGRYSLDEHQAEEISGGRFIIGDKVWGPEIEDKPS